MSFGEIKYALNSTVGTDEFKPINVILGEMEDKISNLPFCIASDVIRSSSDGAVTVSGTTTYTKRKEIIISRTGIMRVKFSLNRVSAGVWTGYGRIYINDVAVGTERSVANDVVTTFTEDIAVKVGDRVQLYMRTSITSAVTLQASNFQLCYEDKRTDVVVL
ncbi:MAG: hypothetical protein PHW03_07240 [Eubacteriales bacterium]|nr:hypothetical protein [Eubacteriales bacterium]